MLEIAIGANPLVLVISIFIHMVALPLVVFQQCVSVFVIIQVGESARRLPMPLGEDYVLVFVRHLLLNVPIGFAPPVVEIIYMEVGALVVVADLALGRRMSIIAHLIQFLPAVAPMALHT